MASRTNTRRIRMDVRGAQECRESICIGLRVAGIARCRSRYVINRFPGRSRAVMAIRANANWGCVSKNSPQESRVIGRIGSGVASTTIRRGINMSRRLSFCRNAIMTRSTSSCSDRSMIECGAQKRREVAGVCGSVAGITLNRSRDMVSRLTLHTRKLPGMAG